MAAVLKSDTVVGQQSGLGDLVAAQIAEFLGAGSLGLQNPVVLGALHGDGVTDLAGRGNIAVVDVDGSGLVHQHHAGGFHTVGVGDAGHHTGDDDGVALGGVTGIGDGAQNGQTHVPAVDVALQHHQVAVVETAVLVDVAVTGQGDVPLVEILLEQHQILVVDGAVAVDVAGDDGIGCRRGNHGDQQRQTEQYGNPFFHC